MADAVRERGMAPTTERAASVGVLLGAGGVLSALLGAFGVVAMGWQHQPPPPGVLVVLTTASATATLVGGAVFALGTRRELQQLEIPMVAALSVLAIVVIGAGEAAPLLVAEPGRGFEIVRSAGLLAALALSLLAATPLRQTRLQPLGTLAFGAGLLGAATGAAGMWFVAWAAITVVHGAAHVRSGQERQLWLGLALSGFAVAELARGAVIGSPAVWAIAVPVLRSLGVTLAILAIVDGLVRARLREQAEAASSRQRIEHLRRLEDEGDQARLERDHQARSALAAIEFVAGTLRRRAATIDAAVLGQLQAAIGTEVSLLRRLLTLPAPGRQAAAFSLADAIRPVAAVHELRGLRLSVECPPACVAMGDPAATAEIVQILLDNAAQHAPGAAVRLTARHDSSRVVLQVDDDGPGIDTDRRQAVFGRGGDAGHPTSASGRGLGLFIAAKLAEELRGHLWVTESESGGASFRLAMPAGAPGTEAGFAVGRRPPVGEPSQAAP